MFIRKHTGPNMAYFISLILCFGIFNLNYALQSTPDNCERVTSNTQHDSLECKIRTFGSDWNVTYFNPDLSEQLAFLNVHCSSVLFFQSSLEPRSFQLLYHLRHLSIEFCKLTKLPDGTFLGLDNLKTLVLRTHNSDWSAMILELTGDSLVGMSRLETLDLGENNIWNLPKRIFCPLPALQHLNLTANRLQDMSEVGAMGSCGAFLVTLDLSSNDLVILPETGLAGLQSLRKLYLQYNRISKVQDGAFVGLSTINLLNISSNQISSLPPDAFNETLQLRELYIQNNSLNIIAPGLFAALSQLTVLDMSFNQLTSEWIMADTFRGLFRLVVLNLSHNRLSLINSDIFKDLSAIQVLDLSHNELKLISDRTFTPLANLHRLDLSHNHLLAVDGQSFAGLYVLSALSLSHNNISHVAAEAFDNCTSLKDLHIEYNVLNEIPESFNELLSLRTLRISNNIIGTIKATDLTQLGSLVHLDMSHNKLKGICKHCFENQCKLKVLDLARNNLSAVPQGSFDSNLELQLLRLDGNKLSDINGLFASLSELIWLNVSDNRITWFDYALIPDQLLHLDIHNNQIGDIGNYFNIESKLALRTLDASHNKIEHLGPSSIPNSCELLFINSNKITEIAPGTFTEKNNISMVDLFDNLLSKIDLTSINLPLVPDDKSVPEFYIGGNPIFCDCHMEWMHRIHQISGLRQHPRIMDLDKITCTLPYPRSGENRVSFLKTEPSQFLCPYTSHCFALCQCCDFIACDCQMTCPDGCSCYHDDTWATNIVDCSARGHHQLSGDIPMDATIVYMDSNDMPILSPHHFIGRMNIISLFLNSSRVERIQNRTFHGLSSLQKLHLEDNAIEVLEGFEFENLYQLRELYLQNNNLKYIDNSTFSALKSIEVIKLNGNNIMDYPVWHFKLNPSLNTLTLGGNPWSCECGYMVDFKSWLTREKSVVMNAKEIFCVTNSTGEQGPFVLESSFSCEQFVATTIIQKKLENDYLQPVLITLGIFFIILIIGIMIVVIRIRCKGSVTKSCGARCFFKEGLSTKNIENKMLYDIFISYSEMDSFFIHNVFAAEIKNNDNSYKVGLAFKENQTAGTDIGDFILKSVQYSHTFILVLTKNFINNDWCKFSFKKAHLYALKALKNKLLVVMCGDICEDDLDFDLRSTIKLSTKLKYEDKSFWSKLHASLPSATMKLSNQCFINDSNYITNDNGTPNHSIKSEVSLVPSLMMTQPVKMNNLYQNHQHNHSYQKHQQPPSFDFSDMDKTFTSMDTTQSSLAPSLNHPYMSIDYSQARKSHIYDSIDNTTTASPPLVHPPSLPSMHPAALQSVHPASLPSVHTLHQHLRQQHPQQNTQLSEELLLLQQQQQYHRPQQKFQQHHCPQTIPISAPPGFGEPTVSASYFI